MDDDRETTDIDALGSANFGIAVGTDPADYGDLYIVAQRAQVFTQGETAVSSEPYGFAESWLIHIPVDYSVTPVTLAGPLRERNLNRDVLLGSPDHVPPEDAISQPMAVVPYYRGSSPVLFIASFGTDRVLRIGNLAASANLWSRSVVDIGVSGTGSPVAGPRGLAIVLGSTPAQDRLYVLNRLDNSIAVIDPANLPTGPIIPTPLQNDPTPLAIQEGRKLLYDARLSARGFNSCAGCHIDARLDGLRWDLSDGVQQPLLTQAEMDVLFDSILGIPLNNPFIANKGSMVTQSLQGLVNWQAELDRDAGLESQLLFTNAPYHWRGDRHDFLAFRPAFRSLIGTPADMPEKEMKKFELFINSISYPPNPFQPKDRRPTGSLGSDPNATDPGPASIDIGSGSFLGLKAWHVVPATADRSCVHCHSLPEGSNNRIPQRDAQFPPNPNDDNGPIFEPLTNAEVAALRGEVEKEITPKNAPGATTGGIGVFRAGTPETIRSITTEMIEVGLTSTDPQVVAAVQEATADFVEQLDTGVAPMVGRCVTHEISGGPVSIPPEVSEMIQQARAGNIGIAIHAWSGGAMTGYWYDQSSALATGFRAETATGPGSTLTDYVSLASQLPAESVVITHATPLGSERRGASASGSPVGPVAGPAPTLASWLQLAPNTMYEFVPLFLDNWDPQPPTSQIHALQASPMPVVQGMVLSRQQAQGLPRRHEPPRRIRIAGTDIRHGAQLEIRFDGTCGGTAYDVKLPLYAIDDVDAAVASTDRIWTTAVEPEPHIYYQWLVDHHSHTIRVVNTDGTSACVEEVEMTLKEIEGFTRGDVNGDGGVDGMDTIALSFGGPFPCADAADVDDDGDVDGADATALGAYLSAQDPALIPYPGPGICGPDLSDDALDCDTPHCP
jgi:hypothetical protein